MCPENDFSRRMSYILSTTFVVGVFGGEEGEGLLPLIILFVAMLAALSFGIAVVFTKYRDRVGVTRRHGFRGISSRSVSDAPVRTEGGGSAYSTRAMLEISREESGGMSSEAIQREKKVSRPMRTVSDVERWKFVAAFVVTGALGAAAFALGDLPVGSETVLVLASLAAFFLGTVLLASGFTSLRTYHVVRDTPTTDVAELSADDVGETVEMYGQATVSDHGTHEAPFSDDDCLVCEYEIVEKPGKDEVVDSGTAGVPFYVDDGTSKVLVDPEDARLKMPLDTEKEVESQEPPSELQGGYVDVGVNEVESEYRERYLEPGEDVYVYGDAVGSDGEDVVVNRGREDSIFLIADSSEGELRKSLLSKAAAYGMTGIALMSVGMGFVFWLSGLSIPTV